MNRRIIQMLSVGALCGVPAVYSPAAEPNALQGSWVAVTAERNGSLAWDIRGHALIVHGNRFEIRSADDRVLFAGTLVETSGRPAGVDFILDNGPTWRGIYERRGDRLRICDNADDPSRERPRYFNADPNTGYVLVDFRRVP